MKNIKKLIAIILVAMLLFTSVVVLCNCAAEEPAEEVTHTLIFETGLGDIDLGIDGFAITEMYGRIINWLRVLVDNILHFIETMIHIENF